MKSFRLVSAAKSLPHQSLAALRLVPSLLQSFSVTPMEVLIRYFPERLPAICLAGLPAILLEGSAALGMPCPPQAWPIALTRVRRRFDFFTNLPQ